MLIIGGLLYVKRQKACLCWQLWQCGSLSLNYLTLSIFSNYLGGTVFCCLLIEWLTFILRLVQNAHREFYELAEVLFVKSIVKFLARSNGSIHNDFTIICFFSVEYQWLWLVDYYYLGLATVFIIVLNLVISFKTINLPISHENILNNLTIGFGHKLIVIIKTGSKVEVRQTVCWTPRLSWAPGEGNFLYLVLILGDNKGASVILRNGILGIFLIVSIFYAWRV